MSRLIGTLEPGGDLGAENVGSSITPNAYSQEEEHNREGGGNKEQVDRSSSGGR
jgi:hypothetical protein